MISDQEFMTAIHMEIHAVRRIAGYKPSIMEKNISKLVIQKFSDTCKECKEQGESLKNQPIKKSGGIMGAIKNSLGGLE